MASSYSLSSLDFDLQLAARAGIQSLHSFISLFSLQAPSSSLQLQLQHQQSMAASETITQFKHLGTLLSQRTGHARVRQAPRIGAATNSLSDSLLISTPSSPTAINPSVNPNSPPLNPIFHIVNPNSPQINPNSASEGFQFSQVELPASQATASTSFNDECNYSGAFGDEGQSTRGSSYIDLNDYYNSEGSINKLFSRRGYNYIEANKGRDNYPSKIFTYDSNDKHNNNNGFPSIINDNNPSSFDLNQEAPSLESSSLSSPQANCLESKYNYMLTSSTKQTRPPLFCPPPSQESFSFDAHTQSAAALSLAAPSVSNNPYASSDDELTEFANPNQRLTLYEGHNNEGSLSRQFAKILSTNLNFEAQLEKAACLITTPTNSCISLEGSLPAYGSLPRVQQTQPDKSSSALVKRKCPSISDDSKLTKCGSSPSKCHCAKRRKLKNKSIKRVPAISDKVAEIPHDDYSWRKYGQKPIKGSPYPRGYYKCSGVKGCPAKKHVERALDDPSMLIVTYEGEHIHSKPVLEEASPI